MPRNIKKSSKSVSNEAGLSPIERVNQEEKMRCDASDDILRLLVKRGLSARDSLFILEKARKAIEDSIYAAKWDEPLVCKASFSDLWTGHRADLKYFGTTGNYDKSEK